MDFRTIRYEQLGAVLRITANRPEVLNAQSRVMILELDEAFRAASEDDAIRVIIVAGAGAHFSAGHDLGSPDELEDQQAHPVGPGLPENLKRLSELYLETCLRWREVPKPTIAQVQGYCIMGGLMLASCCDLIIAAADALFADRAVRWGAEMRRRIERYRHAPSDPRASYQIGCIILVELFFWSRPAWIPAPADFSRNIVQGKTYDLTTPTGSRL
jgi:enoyl-CoA hydratase/carnithine racemase